VVHDEDDGALYRPDGLTVTTVFSTNSRSEPLLTPRKPLEEIRAVSAMPTDWRSGLPELADGRVTVRELRPGDARSLLAHLGDARVSRYLTPCPSTVAAFFRFIRWTHAERRRGKLVCYGIVPTDAQWAVGVIQVWAIERGFSTAEWGFALGRSFWGTGIFERAAGLVLDAVFAELGVYRLEARAVDVNERGNRALEKLGATREGVLRGGFHDAGVIRDHVMWSLLAPEWQATRATG
jgi:RimJ/RimL family protein N-acetyltransferase